MILFLDTETTGLPPDRSASVADTDAWPRLVEVAWQAYSTDRKPFDKKALLVRPDGFEIPDEAASVHGISTAHATSSGTELQAVLKVLNERLADVDVVVAHHAWFDLGVLVSEFQRAGVDTNLEQKPVICTMRSATDFCAREGATGGAWPSLSVLYETLTGRSPLRAHRAAADVRTLVSCFWKLVARDVVDPDRPGSSLASAGYSVGDASLDSHVHPSHNDGDAPAHAEERRLDEHEDEDERALPEPQEGFVIDEVHERLSLILQGAEENEEENNDNEASPPGQDELVHSREHEGEEVDQEGSKSRLSVLEAFYRRVGRFHAQGLSRSEPSVPIDSTLAVAYNYLCRGRPTRASLQLSERMLDLYMPEAGATVEKGSRPTIDVAIAPSFWEDIDAASLREAMEAPLSANLAELAGRVGQRPLQLLRLSRSLIHAAHIQITIVWTLIQRGASVAKHEGGDEFRVCVEGLEEEVARFTCDDLTTLLRQLAVLRRVGGAAPLQIRAVNAPEDSHLVIRGTWGSYMATEVPENRPGESEARVKAGGADASPAPQQVELLYPDDSDSEDKRQWRKRRVFAEPIPYHSIGEVQRKRDGDKETQTFEIEDEQRGAALEYILQNALRKRAFRPGQLAIIDRALQGKDVIGLLPTGGGKSLTYQICGLLQPGTVVIVDPLNSLMQDQYDKLCEEWMNASDYINSFYGKGEKERVRADLEKGKLHFLFVGPERLQMPLYRESFERSLRSGVEFSYGVIDEAHCVSEWGHDFRHVYLHLADNLQRFCTGTPTESASGKKSRLPLFGLTATASYDVLADVQRELKIGEDAIITLPADAIDRKELNFRILPVDAHVEPGLKFFERERQLGRPKYDKAEAFIRSLPDKLHKLKGNPESEVPQDLGAFFGANGDGKYENAGVIFCPTKSDKLENGVLALRDGKDGLEGLKGRISELEIVTFFAKQNNETVKDSYITKQASKSLGNQYRFMRDKANLMIATKAFGMGIDKPNLRFTLHYTHPGSVENFYQEAGRAGRDGKPAVCGILYHPRDTETNQSFQENSFKGIEREKTILDELLEEVRYEDRFFLRTIEGGVRELLDVYVRLNLFPSGDGEKPFLLYLNGKWHDDPSERICYGCLHLKDLEPFKPGKYRQKASAQEAEWVLNTVRDLIKKEADTSDYAEYLTRVKAPGILTQLRSASHLGDTRKLVIGFTSNTVQEMTARLKEEGLLFDRKKYEAEDEVVRAAYNFSKNEDEFIERLNFFIERLNFQYGKYSKYRRDLNLSKETEQFFRANFPKIRNPTDTQRALYRLSVLGIIDDYDINYARQKFNVRFKGKSDQAYRNRLEQYFRRYLGEDSTDEWLSQLDDLGEPSMIRRCLWTQIDFVYKEIVRKRKRAVEYMDTLCQEGIERGESHFRESIVYYFTSKYAREEFLPEALDKGKVETLEVVDTYIDYVFNPPDGLGGQIDNAKHLRGACARLQTSLTGENAVIDVLNAFSILVLDSVKYGGDSERPIEASEEAVASYKRGFRSFMSKPSTSWGKLLDTLERFHRRLREINVLMEKQIWTERDALLVERTAQRLAEFNQAMSIS